MKKLEDVEGIEREKSLFECDVNDPEAEVKWFKGDKVSEGFKTLNCNCCKYTL